MQLGRAFAGPCLACAKYLLPLALLAALAGSIFYVRILYGPISLKVLAEPIARSIAAEVPGFGVSVEDALVRLNEEGQLEFRLRNVRLMDGEGEPVASAPLAAVELSLDGLWSARLSPAKVVLIEPRLLLAYSADGGLTFSFARPPELRQSALPGDAGTSSGAAEPRLSGSGAGQGLPVALRQLDLARVIAEASARARQRSDAASFLREIGMRNATVSFEHDGGQTVWRVPRLDLALSHKRRRSVFEGAVTIASGRGPWSLEFWSEASEATQQVRLKAAIRDLVPGTIAEMLPGLAPLRGVDVPASGAVTLELTSSGRLLGGQLSVELSHGEMRLPWLAGLPLTIEGGSLDLRYDPASRSLRIEPSTLAWGRSRLTVEGGIGSAVGPDGAEVWSYRLSGVEGWLAPEELDVAPVAIESWLAEGWFRPDTGVLAIDQTLVAGGGELRFSGQVGGSSDAGVRLRGQIGAMPIATLQGLWPRGLGRDVRSWVAHSLVGGRVLGGTFQLERDPRQGPGSGPQKLSVVLQAGELQIRPAGGLPPVEIARALIHLDGPALEITIPEATAVLPDGSRLALKSGRFTAADVLAQRSLGKLEFRGEGPARAILQLVEDDTFRVGRLGGVRSEDIEGTIEVGLTVSLPLQHDITVGDLKLSGQGRLIDGRARKLIGRHDAQAASVVFDITDKAVDARGDMLVSGVPVKLAWQHIFDAPPDKQPPLRLTATLDGADRVQLGIDASQLVHGEVPVEMTITRRADEEHQVHVWADLTRADLVLDHVAWRKPPGRAAIMQFDLEPGTGHETELHNFKIVGDDIAISGWMGLDANDRVREFRFPEFSVSVITRLEVKGVLRPDNVWDIKAQGQTYDGRDVFRSLFSVGELGDKPATRRNEPGVDLVAAIDTVVGFSDVSLRGLDMQLSKRGGKLTRLAMRGTLDGGKPLEVSLQPGTDGAGRLVAVSDDAGQAFRLVDFYPSLVGGRMRLDVDLDGSGPAEKTGLLRVERFRILGDPVVSEVLQFPDENRTSDPARTRRVIRQAIDFDWMRVPFSVGHGQFVMGDSEIRGPLVGATMRGKADFRSRRVNIGGTYVPLQGLNSALGIIPGLGQLLAGPRGEGVLGITFAIQGPMAQPQVLVNPLSLVAPGIFREIFQLTPSQSVTPPPSGSRPQAGPGPRSSSAPASAVPAGRTGAVEPEVLTGWSSQTSPGAVPKAK